MTPEQREEANEKRQHTYTEEWRARRSVQAKEKMTDEVRGRIRDKMTEFWAGNDKEKAHRRELQLSLYSDGFGDVISELTAKALSDSGIRKRMSEAGLARWSSMSEQDKDDFSQACAEVWTEEMREEARQRSHEFQSNLTVEQRNVVRQKKLNYWTPERRIERGDLYRGDIEHANKIREGVLRFWGKLSKESREELICKCFAGAHSNTSAGEREVRDFILSLCGSAEFNNRSVLGGRELDIYIPSHNVAIEYNGSYYHSVQHLSVKTGLSFRDCMHYHQDKSLECRECGIRLIHIWDWEWADVRIRERLKSQIRGVFGLSDRVFARKCKLKELSVSESKEFFSLNSEFGNKVGILKTFGLLYGDRIVMAYGVSYKQTGRGSYDVGALEIGRSATALNTVVVGGASRLMSAVLSWARREFPHIKKMHYFVDFDKHSGSSLKAMGFDFLGVTPPTIRIVFNRNVVLVSKKGELMEVKHGKVYSRMPAFHQAIKEQDMMGNLLTLANAGTLHYMLSFNCISI